jgi:hypothetical protein
MNNSDGIRQHYHHPFFWGAVSVALLMVALYVFAGVMVYLYGPLVVATGWDTKRRGDAWLVSSVDPQGSAAGQLAVNDRFLAINSDTRVALAGPKLKKIQPNSVYSLLVARSGVEKQFMLTAPVKRDYWKLGRTLSFLIISAAFFLLALLMGLLKPEESINSLGLCRITCSGDLLFSVCALALRKVFSGWRS